MDREALETLAKSNIATQRINTSDIRDIVTMIEAAEGRAKRADGLRVDGLLADRSHDRSTNAVRLARQQTQMLVDLAEDLVDEVDAEGTFVHRVTRSDVRELVELLDAAEAKGSVRFVERTIVAGPRAQAVLSAREIKQEARILLDLIQSLSAALDQ